MEYVTFMLGPKLRKLRVKLLSNSSFVMRYTRKYIQASVITYLSDDDLATLDENTRLCITLIQQERRRRTKLEFAVARDTFKANEIGDRAMDDGYVAISPPTATVSKNGYATFGDADSDSDSEDENDENRKKVRVARSAMKLTG